MHLREDVLEQDCSPIRGICTSVVNRSCRANNRTQPASRTPDSSHELARLIHESCSRWVRRCFRRSAVKSDVPSWESFASEMSPVAPRTVTRLVPFLAGRRVSVLLYAHLQPEIVFDETITRRGLGRLPRPGDARLRRHHAIDGRADQKPSGQGRDHREAMKTCSGDQARHPAGPLPADGHNDRTKPPCRPSPPSFVESSTNDTCGPVGLVEPEVIRISVAITRPITSSSSTTAGVRPICRANRAWSW